MTIHGIQVLTLSVTPLTEFTALLGGNPRRLHVALSRFCGRRIVCSEFVFGLS